MATNVSISVLIPSYNSRRTIRTCLLSVQRQETDFAYEVIVVDSSRDGTPDLIRSEFPDVKLIRLAQKTFAGVARNIAASSVQSDLLAFIDSDCTAPPGWLRSLAYRLQNGESVVGGAVDNGTPLSLIGTADYLLAFSEFSSSAPVRTPDFLVSCNLGVKRQLFLDSGGFPRLFTAEDTALTRRLSLRSTLCFDPTIVVSHTNRENARDYLFHHFMFGKFSAIVRKSLPIPGRMLAACPLLAFFAFPIRIVRVITRFAGWKLVSFDRFLVLLPWIFVGTAAWGAGFVIGAWSRERLKP